MNIFYCGGFSDNTIKIGEKIIGKYKPKFYGVIWDDIERKNKSSLLKSGVSFYHEDMIKGEYEKYDFYNECPPLDVDIIEKMSVYENEIMQMMDRCYPQDYNIRLYFYYKHLRFWNYALDKMKIDLYVHALLPHEVYDYIIYCLCKIKKIKFIGSFPSPIKDYSYIVEDIYNQCPEIKLIYEELSKKHQTTNDVTLPVYLENIYNKHTDPSVDKTPYYMKEHESSMKKSPFYQNKIKVRASIIKSRIKFILFLIKNVFSLNISLMEKVSLGINWYSNFREPYNLLDFYKRNVSKFKEGDKYIYVPLHMQPEVTTSPLGGKFVNQLLFIKMLSFYLPNGYYLYVKEHPCQVMQSEIYRWVRNSEFYKEIVNLKNVKLMSLEEDTFKLIEGATAIASVIGTAGFEGLFKGKPFLMFGNYITQYAPNVFSIKHNEECRDALNKILESDGDSSTVNLKDLKIYLRALHEVIFFDNRISVDLNIKVDSNVKCMDITDAYIIKIDEFFKNWE